MLVLVVPNQRKTPHKVGRGIGVKKTVEGKTMVGLQTEAAGGHASVRVGPLSALVATLHHLVHPLGRKKLAAEASAEDERKRVPKRIPLSDGSGHNRRVFACGRTLVARKRNSWLPLPGTACPSAEVRACEVEAFGLVPHAPHRLDAQGDEQVKPKHVVSIGILRWFKGTAVLN